VVIVSTTPRRILRATAASLVLLSTPAVASGQEAGVEPSCSSPYAPVYRYDASRGTPPDLDAQPVPSTIVRFPDSVGWTDERGTVTVTRPDGDLTLFVESNYAEAYEIPDVDGDGIDETWVVVYNDAFFPDDFFPDETDFETEVEMFKALVHGGDEHLEEDELLTDAIEDGFLLASYVVPGATATGAHDAVTVGVEVPASWPLNAAERTGDDVVDVFGFSLDFGGEAGVELTTTLLSGSHIAATQPGGDAFDAVVAEYAGVLGGFVSYDPELPAVLTIDESSGMDDEYAVLRVYDGGAPVALRAPYEVLDDELVLGRALQGANGRFLVVQADIDGDVENLVWSLDDPCTALTGVARQPVVPVSQTTSTTAPARTMPVSTAAVPVKAQPTFTG
jgi:hypothetical protein